MFGISLTELALIAVVTLVIVGPQKLPSMLRTLGEWARRLRRITTEVRAQTGIDEILRQEGIDGGLNELRGMLRGDLGSIGRDQRPPVQSPDPYRDVIEIDSSREYPPEGVDACEALADDLVDEHALEPDPIAEGTGPDPITPPEAGLARAKPEPPRATGSG